MKYLGEFDPAERLYVDVETISFDDNVEATNPWAGHRVAGYTLAQWQGEKKLIRYFPIRHRTEGASCVPIGEFLDELRVLAAQVPQVCNAFLKFDVHFSFQDGVTYDTATFECLEVLARLVNNDLMKYSLDAMAERWCPSYRKSNTVAEWCLANKTKDYGRVPIHIMESYACQDLNVAMEVHRALLAALPAQSMQPWIEECMFADMLVTTEEAGVQLDLNFLRFKQCELLDEMAGLEEKMFAALSRATDGKIASLNCRSSKQLTRVMAALGVEPVAWNVKEDERGNIISKTPSWDGKAMEAILLNMEDEESSIYKAIEAISAFKKAATAEATFCSGWMGAATNGVMHPNFKSGGTATGRISSSDPNIQNPTKWVMEGIIIPRGRVGVRFDYSQIEYRIFAHYAGDEALLQSYRDNPAIDYHQILSDRLGIERDPTKTLNFGMLYGMGKKKLKKSLAKEIRKLLTTDRSKFNEVQNASLDAKIAKLRRYGREPGEMAEAIYEEYHRLVPGIRKLNEQAKAVIEERGWVRNLFGRRYQFTPDRAYIACNYICQGSAADLFKSRCNALWRECRQYDITPVTNIHDAFYAHMPADAVPWYWETCKGILGDVRGVIDPRGEPTELRVPILSDGECYTRHWGMGDKVTLDSGKKSYARYENGEVLKLGNIRQATPPQLLDWCLSWN